MSTYRGPIFGVIAIALVIGYGFLGSRVAPVLLPGGTPTPTPPKPVQPVEAPRVSGTIAFTLRGDVYLLSQGRYVSLTKDGRSSQPDLARDGRTILFARAESVDGKRDVEGQVTHRQEGSVRRHRVDRRQRTAIEVALWVPHRDLVQPARARAGR